MNRNKFHLSLKLYSVSSGHPAHTNVASYERWGQAGSTAAGRASEDLCCRTVPRIQICGDEPHERTFSFLYILNETLVQHLKVHWNELQPHDANRFNSSFCNCALRRLRWSRGSVLAFGTQVRGFKPDRSRWIFQGEKILSTPSFGSKVVCPMSYIYGM